MSFNIFDFLMSLLDLTVADYLRAVWGEHLWVEILLDLVGMVILATFALLTVVAIIDKALPADTPALLRVGAQLAGNLVIGLAVLELARRWARKQRQAQDLAANQVAAATRQRLSHLS